MSVSDCLWSERKKAAMKIRAKIVGIARSWFKRHEFVEVQGPILIPAIGSRPNCFEVRYFDRKAHLAQGLQPYAEILMANLGRIYTVAPVFRAEKVRSRRHLIEYWRIEAEMPHCSLDSLLMMQEQLIGYICRKLSREAGAELESTRRDPKELERIQPPFHRLTYGNAIKTLQKDGYDIQWGAVLDSEHEKHLSLCFSRPFFISGFPIGIETFLYRSHPQEPEVTLTADLLAPEGYGELSSAGEPIVAREELRKKIKEERMTPIGQEWHIVLRGSVPYSGFAMGVERLTQWICKLESIEEVSAFPRAAIDIYP